MPPNCHFVMENDDSHDNWFDNNFTSLVDTVRKIKKNAESISDTLGRGG